MSRAAYANALSKGRTFRSYGLKKTKSIINRARDRRGYGRGLSDAAKAIVAALKKTKFTRSMMGKTYKSRFKKIAYKRRQAGYGRGVRDYSDYARYISKNYT